MKGLDHGMKLFVTVFGFLTLSRLVKSTGSQN